MFQRGFGGDPFWMGQAAMSKDDRDGILSGISRTFAEADEIDAWVAANPLSQVLTAGAIPPGPMARELAYPRDRISPYYQAYWSAKPLRPQVAGIQSRLSAPDPSSWQPLTDAERTVYDNWMKTVDGAYGAFKADPMNLAVGNWKGNVRVPDVKPGPMNVPPAPGTPPAPAGAPSKPSAAFPTTTVLVGGGVAAVGAAALLLAGRPPWLGQVPLVRHSGT